MKNTQETEEEKRGINEESWKKSRKGILSHQTGSTRQKKEIFQTHTFLLLSLAPTIDKIINAVKYTALN